MKKSGKLLAVIMVLALVFLIGCGSGGETNDTTTKTSETTTARAPIKLAVYPLTSPYFEYAIDELGLFKKNNAKVELVYFAQYADVIQALNSGSVDGAIMGVTEAVAPIINDQDLKIIAMTDYSYGMDGIVVKSNIKSIKELKGQTIATNIGTMNHMLLLRALKENGMTANDVNITNMSEGDATAAFVGGSIKAASIFDPQMSSAAKQGHGKIIYSSKDMEGELADVLLMKGSVVSERKTEVQGIINAWYECLETYKATPDKVIDIICKKADLPKKEFLSYLNGLKLATVSYNKEKFANGGEEMAEIISNTAKFLLETKCVSEVPDKEKIKSAIDSSFVENMEE